MLLFGGIVPMTTASDVPGSFEPIVLQISTQFLYSTWKEEEWEEIESDATLCSTVWDFCQNHGSPILSQPDIKQLSCNCCDLYYNCTPDMPT